MKRALPLFIFIFAFGCKEHTSQPSSGSISMNAAIGEYSSSLRTATVVIQITNYTSLPGYYHTYNGELLYSFGTWIFHDSAATVFRIGTKSYSSSIIGLTYDSVDLQIIQPFSSIFDTIYFDKGSYELATTISDDSLYLKYHGLTMNVSCRFVVQ